VILCSSSLYSAGGARGKCRGANMGAKCELISYVLYICYIAYILSTMRTTIYRYRRPTTDERRTTNDDEEVLSSLHLSYMRTATRFPVSRFRFRFRTAPWTRGRYASCLSSRALPMCCFRRPFLLTSNLTPSALSRPPFLRSVLKRKYLEVVNQEHGSIFPCPYNEYKYFKPSSSTFSVSLEITPAVDSPLKINFRS
jgi:hypothetical protein